MSNSQDALTAVHLADARACDRELAQAVVEAVERLKAKQWPNREVVRDGYGVEVVLWTSPFPVGRSPFAFDADAQPYWWASRAGSDRQGRWFKAKWAQYRPDEEPIRDAIRWVNSLAR